MYIFCGGSQPLGPSVLSTPVSSTSEGQRQAAREPSRCCTTALSSERLHPAPLRQQLAIASASQIQETNREVSLYLIKTERAESHSLSHQDNCLRQVCQRVQKTWMIFPGLQELRTLLNHTHHLCVQEPILLSLMSPFIFRTDISIRYH